MPNLTLVALGALLLVWVLLEQTVFGRRLYAIGGNAEAARLAGVRVRPLRLAAFGLSGLGAAGGGPDVCEPRRLRQSDPRRRPDARRDRRGVSRHDDERGGRAARARTLAGVLILGVLGNGLTQMNVDSYVRDILTGSIIIPAVAASSFGRAREG